MALIRPRIVTLLSWLFIISGVIGVCLLIWLQFNPALLKQFAISLEPVLLIASWWSSLIYLVVGVALFFGKNWGRHLLWIAHIPVLVVTLVTSPRLDVFSFSLILLVVIVWPLFTPLVKRYFTGEQTESDVESLLNKGKFELALWRKVIGILLFIVSGILIYLISFLSFLNVYGQYEILVEALLTYTIPWLVVHSVALVVFQSPTRYLASSIAFLSGVSFTLFLIWVIFNYPLPTLDGSVDIKESFSGFASGLLVSGILGVLGVLQLVVHFLGCRAQSPDSI